MLSDSDTAAGHPTFEFFLAIREKKASSLKHMNTYLTLLWLCLSLPWSSFGRCLCGGSLCHSHPYRLYCILGMRSSIKVSISDI